MKQQTQQMNGPVGTPGYRCGHRLVAALLVGIFLAVLPMSVGAQQDETRTQDLIRSAMVFNFCKFVEWPEKTPSDSIVLGVIGDADALPDFSSIEGKSIGRLPIEIRTVENSEDLRACHLVYIAGDQQDRVDQTLSVAQAESILTISEINGFCRDGGIIQLVERRGKIRFFINRQAADRAQLSLSSQLLKVAKIVEGS